MCCDPYSRVRVEVISASSSSHASSNSEHVNPLE